VHEKRDVSETAAGVLGAEALGTLYEHLPDGVLFAAPDGRVMAANPAACEILGRGEVEMCSLGHQGTIDHTDDRWGLLLAELGRTGRVSGAARMIRGDGVAVEVELIIRVFTAGNGEPRTCTILRDVTERERTADELAEMSRLRELTITDELTGLHNRRGFVAVGSQILELANRQLTPALLLFVDIDDLKGINDQLGHIAGDAALRIVARALRETLRRADAIARIGGDEFVALAVGLDHGNRNAIEQRIDEYLTGEATVAAVGRRVAVSMGWATRAGHRSRTLEGLIVEADGAMYRVKAKRHRSEPG
jgi:diguanylate cyclase (GGDEF)-like protein/PAS domain S-box-containing protein